MKAFSSEDVLAEITAYYPEDKLQDLTTKRLTCLVFMVDWLLTLKTPCEPANRWYYDESGVSPIHPIFDGAGSADALPDAAVAVVQHVVESTMLLNENHFYRTVLALYPLLMTARNSYLDLPELARRWHHSLTVD